MSHDNFSHGKYYYILLKLQFKVLNTLGFTIIILNTLG
jgi:hypothetical protein